MNHPFLVIMAMKEESQGLFEARGVSVIYTGLGKVNASYHLTKHLTARKTQGATVKAVFNFGTAGSFTLPTHSTVECVGFVQKDMDVSPLGIPIGVTPFEHVPKLLEVPRRLPHLPMGICGTGDKFETQVPAVACDVVDMEAYALAKVCWFEQVPFAAIKYITDGSDENAHKDWVENLPAAAKSFVQAYDELLARF